MTLRFIDSFDHYTTILDKWAAQNNCTIIVGAARTGAYGLNIPHSGTSGRYVSLTMDAQETWIVGQAGRFASFSGSIFLVTTIDVTTIQGALKLNTDGTLSIVRGTTVLATSVLSLVPNVFYYIEFKHVIADAGGLLEVIVNGAQWATLSGDTQQTANATANVIRLGSIVGDGTVTRHVDDVYICDGVDQSIADPNSPPNNDYLGDRAVRFLGPTGLGTYGEFATVVGASRWGATAEVPPDEDTSYVEDTVVNRRDTYAMGDLPAGTYDIPGVQLIHRVRETDAGARKFARMLRHTATDSQGADLALSTSYAYYLELLGSDPIAAAAWAKANIDAMELGLRVRS